MHTLNKIPGLVTNKEIHLLTTEASKVPVGGTIVEIGSHLGKSTVAMSRVAKRGVMIYAIDPWDDRLVNGEMCINRLDQFLENIKSCKNIIPVARKSEDAIKEWIEDSGENKIDLLFIDGDHTKDGCLHDLQAWVPHVKKGGVVLLHDFTEECCGVKDAFKRFAGEYLANHFQVVGSTLRVQV